MHPPKRAFAGTQKSFGGFRVFNSVIHYIACDGGKFGTCNYDVNLERKEKKPNASLRSILITSILMEKRGEGVGGGGVIRIHLIFHLVHA